MESKELIEIIFFLFSLLGLWVLYFVIFKRLVVDYFRQRMFALRDELFIEAAEGRIAFEHPAYCLLRSTMNGFLRFGHKINLLEVVISFLLLFKDSKAPVASFEENWKNSISELDEETKKLLDGYRNKMHQLLWVHILKGSPLLSLIIFVLLIAFSGLALLFKFATLDWLKESCKKPISGMESTAMVFGQ